MPDDLELAEEAMFRLRYGDALGGIEAMCSDYIKETGKIPSRIEVVPQIYREYIKMLAIDRRYMRSSAPEGAYFVLFNGVPVHRGPRCLAT